MSLWRSYRNLSQRTRLILGGSIMAYATAGLFLSEKAESFFGFTPTEQDKQALKDAVPKFQFVEKDKKEKKERTGRFIARTGKEGFTYMTQTPKCLSVRACATNTRNFLEASAIFSFQRSLPFHQSSGSPLRRFITGEIEYDVYDEAKSQTLDLEKFCLPISTLALVTHHPLQKPNMVSLLREAQVQLEPPSWGMAEIY
ncbi:hypothetical protein AC578_828 [Pseudocercospora eumusae]|uniref:Uncharacterized protein n=1 Tax=Pseudocercospora eumusae TaxID=321146 RepID=A0A139GUE9_9PEZI|nr:hypothetical protein AC578_828 [Pseudocercospora eumusae]